MSDRIIAPWTEEQVEGLTYWQDSGRFHPYTCPRRSSHPVDDNGEHGVLTATVDGWVCDHCDYTQDWAHGFSAARR